MLSDGQKKIVALVSKFPKKPGVYLFFDNKDNLLYVGKATDLRSRVSSYFKGQRSSRPIEEMIDEVKKIKYEVTDSVLEAIILEAKKIKEDKPKYNILGRDDKSWNYIVITKDDYPGVKFVREHDLELWQKEKGSEIKNISRYFGPYPGLNTKEAMKIFRKLFFVSECTPGQKRGCLYYQMHQCLGVCVGDITAKEYRQKVIGPFIKFLSGNKKQVIKILEKNMSQAAKKDNFEEAARLRNQVFALKKISDVTLLNKSFFSNDIRNKNYFSVKRIEGYDISNLGEHNKVGSMVVFDSTGPVKKEYRKFNIKTVSGQSDVDCLKEVLSRRLKRDDWAFPEVILIDGGLPQVNVAKKILKQFKKDICLLGIAKGPKRNKNEFILSTKNPSFLAWVKENEKLLVQTRDEAHRFAISFHRSKRKLF